MDCTKHQAHVFLVKQKCVPISNNNIYYLFIYFLTLPLIPSSLCALDFTKKKKIVHGKNSTGTRCQSPIRLINKCIFKIRIYAEINHFEAYLLLTLTISLHLIEHGQTSDTHTKKATICICEHEIRGQSIPRMLL